MKTKLLLTTASVLLAVGIATTCGLLLGGKQPGSTITKTSPLVTVAELERPAVKQVEAPVQIEPIPQVMETDPEEQVRQILHGIATEPEWSTRAAIAKELRAVSSPEALTVLLPALMENYGRGNTIFNEISDAIARVAQAETVETLEVMHWQASTQAGQGRKILRTIAAIRNPPARRALAKLATRAESPALAACAEEALKGMDAIEVASATDHGPE